MSGFVPWFSCISGWYREICVLFETVLLAECMDRFGNTERGLHSPGELHKHLRTHGKFKKWDEGHGCFYLPSIMLDAFNCLEKGIEGFV